VPVFLCRHRAAAIEWWLSAAWAVPSVQLRTPANVAFRRRRRSWPGQPMRLSRQAQGLVVEKKSWAIDRYSFIRGTTREGSRGLQGTVRSGNAQIGLPPPASRFLTGLTTLACAAFTSRASRCVGDKPDTGLRVKRQLNLHVRPPAERCSQTTPDLNAEVPRPPSFAGVHRRGQER
jgi:hypothetical protein